MASKKNKPENPKRSDTDPNPSPSVPFGNTGERTNAQGAITKDERPPPALPRGGKKKLSAQDQHHKDRSEKLKIVRGGGAQTTGALKPTEGDITTAFEDDDDTPREGDDLGIDVETSITRKFNDDADER